MAKLKGLLVMALVLCFAMQAAVGQDRERRRRGEEERPPPDEEERRAEEEEWRRREKIEEEERRRRREREEWEEEGEGGREDPPVPVVPGEEMFLLRNSRRVVSTEAGEMRVVRAYGGSIVERPLHIGFITMEPRSLFVPQYLDSSLVIFLRRGILLLFVTNYVFKTSLRSPWHVAPAYTLVWGSASTLLIIVRVHLKLTRLIDFTTWPLELTRLI